MTTPALDLAIENVGGVARLAAALRIRPNRVSNWRKRGVPVGWVVRVSRATGGTVPCHLFDPEAFPEVLGEQSEPEPKGRWLDMSLRSAIRNWLLKPSKAELAGDPNAVRTAGSLVFGHIRREMLLESKEGDVPVRDMPELPEGWDR